MAEHKTQTEAPTDGPLTDHAEAARLLRLIAGDGPVTFQTFDESGQVKREKLTKILHGTLQQNGVRLDSLNSDGAGVFFMLNRGDGKGRAAKNVMDVRALFADLDGAPLKPVKDGPLQPHAVVETSPGKYHAYWCVEGVPLEAFKPLQKAIAARFRSDPSVNDLCRLARLPGFFHRKHGGAPFLSRIVELVDLPRYTLEQVKTAFPVALSRQHATKRREGIADVIAKGERNTSLLQLARGFVNKGFALPEASQRIQRINAERCDPPLCATEVDEIVHKAFSVAPKGNLPLPLIVFDSPAYRSLPGNAQAIVNMAYRRLAEGGDGTVCLSPADLAPTMSVGTFRANVKLAAAAGFLLKVEQGRFGQLGNTVDRYQVATRGGAT